MYFCSVTGNQYLEVLLELKILLPNFEHDGFGEMVKSLFLRKIASEDNYSVMRTHTHPFWRIFTVCVSTAIASCVASTDVRWNPVGRSIRQNMQVIIRYARRVGTFWVIKVFAGQRFPRSSSSLASPSRFQNSSRKLREKSKKNQCFILLA